MIVFDFSGPRGSAIWLGYCILGPQHEQGGTPLLRATIINANDAAWFSAMADFVIFAQNSLALTYVYMYMYIYYARPLAVFTGRAASKRSLSRYASNGRDCCDCGR